MLRTSDIVSNDVGTNDDSDLKLVNKYKRERDLDLASWRLQPFHSFPGGRSEWM
jgi:hypothetical protein